MARPNQEAIETFISITGASEAVAVQKLEERGGDLNEAVNAYFNEGDGSSIHRSSAAALEDDVMDIDEPVQAAPREPPFSSLSSATNINPFSLLNPNFHQSFFGSGPDLTSRAPFVSHPRQVREIPIEVKDGGELSGHAPTIEDVTGTAHDHGPETRGTVIIDDDDDEDVPLAVSRSTAGLEALTDDMLGTDSHPIRPRPSAPAVDVLPDYNNDIEEEMVRAAIEASKRELENGSPDQQLGALNDIPGTQQGQSRPEDADIEHAVSLSLKTAEQEKALRDLQETAGVSDLQAYTPMEVGDRGKRASNGRLDVGSSSLHDEVEDVEEQPLVRNRSRHMSSASIDTADEIGGAEEGLPSSPGQPTSVNHLPQSTNDVHNDEWGGMSSLEHDEAVMLEAALFGGIPEGRGYQFPYAPHQLMQNGLDRSSDLYSQRMPRSPSPGLVTQRLLREQQDDEYLASLQADREKAEARRVEEAAAREAALEEERKKEEESRKKLEEEQEIERQLAAKEASLPQEPTADDENAVNLLVRMPDGSRRGRRFVKSDKLKSLFDFIDIGRVVKPGTYRLVRPYPRRAFSDGESAVTLNELGLTSKQEALFLETI